MASSLNSTPVALETFQGKEIGGFFILIAILGIVIGGSYAIYNAVKK